MVNDRRAALAAAIGALIGGFLVYAGVAGMGGGIDWEDRLTFDQSGDLELEGIAILGGLIVGPLVGAPLGTYLALRLVAEPRAGVTAWAVMPVCAIVTFLAFSLVPSGPSDPVLAPYAVFGGWFVSALLTRLFVMSRSFWGSPYRKRRTR